MARFVLPLILALLAAAGRAHAQITVTASSCTDIKNAFDQLFQAYRIALTAAPLSLTVKLNCGGAWDNCTESGVFHMDTSVSDVLIQPKVTISVSASCPGLVIPVTQKLFNISALLSPEARVDVSLTGVSTTGAGGLLLFQAQDRAKCSATLKDVSASNFDGRAVELYNIAKLTMTGGTIAGPGDRGISTSGTIRSSVAVKITGTTFRDITGTAVMLDNVAGPQQIAISKATFRNNTRADEGGSIWISTTSGLTKIDLRRSTFDASSNVPVCVTQLGPDPLRGVAIVLRGNRGLSPSRRQLLSPPIGFPTSNDCRLAKFVPPT